MILFLTPLDLFFMWQLSERFIMSILKLNTHNPMRWQRIHVCNLRTSRQFVLYNCLVWNTNIRTIIQYLVTKDKTDKKKGTNRRLDRRIVWLVLPFCQPKIATSWNVPAPFFIDIPNEQTIRPPKKPKRLFHAPLYRRHFCKSSVGEGEKKKERVKGIPFRVGQGWRV